MVDRYCFFFFFFQSVTTSQSISCWIYCFLSFSICFTLLLLFQWLKEQKVPTEWRQVHFVIFACEKPCAFSHVAIWSNQFTTFEWGQEMVGTPGRLQNSEISAVAVRMPEFLPVLTGQEEKIVMLEAFFWQSVVRRARQSAATNPHCNWKLGAFHRLALLVVQ